MSLRINFFVLLVAFLASDVMGQECLTSSWTQDSTPSGDGSYVYSRVVNGETPDLNYLEFSYEVGDRLTQIKIQVAQYRDGTLIDYGLFTQLTSGVGDYLDGTGPNSGEVYVHFAGAADGVTPFGDWNALGFRFDLSHMVIEPCDELRVVTTYYENEPFSVPLSPYVNHVGTDVRELGFSQPCPCPDDGYTIQCRRWRKNGIYETNCDGVFEDHDSWFANPEVYYDDTLEEWRFRVEVTNYFTPSGGVSMTVLKGAEQDGSGGSGAAMYNHGDGWFSSPFDPCADNPYQVKLLASVPLSGTSVVDYMWSEVVYTYGRVGCDDADLCESSDGVVFVYSLTEDQYSGYVDVLVDGEIVDGFELTGDELLAGGHAIEIEMELEADTVVRINYQFAESAYGTPWTGYVEHEIDGEPDCEGCGCAGEIASRNWGSPGDYEEIPETKDWEVDDEEPGETFGPPEWFPQDFDWPYPDAPIVGDTWLDHLGLGIDPNLIQEQNYRMTVYLPIPVYGTYEAIIDTIPQGHNPADDALNALRFWFKGLFNVMLVLQFGTAAVRAVLEF